MLTKADFPQANLDPARATLHYRKRNDVRNTYGCRRNGVVVYYDALRRWDVRTMTRCNDVIYYVAMTQSTLWPRQRSSVV